MTAFVLGASIMSPKEVWILDFRDIVHEEEQCGTKENEDPRDENAEGTPRKRGLSPERKQAILRSAMRELTMILSNSIDRNLPGMLPVAYLGITGQLIIVRL
jgi:hypothetical protein